MARTLHRDIVLHQATSLPYGGEWHGHDGLARWLQAMDEVWQSVLVKDPHIFEDGETVVVLATFEGHWRGGGDPVRMPICETVSFSDGLPIDWRVFYFDSAAITAHLSAD